jgi:hypothetical protein
MPKHDTTPRDDRWKIGDKGLCIKTGVWQRTDNQAVVPTGQFPKLGKEYTVTGLKIIPKKGLFLYFKEIGPFCYAERHFMKANGSVELEEEVRRLIAADETIARGKKILEKENQQ